MQATSRSVFSPGTAFRGHEEDVDQGPPGDYVVKAIRDRFEISVGRDFPVLKLQLLGESSSFNLDGGRRLEFFYRSEAERGYKPTGGLWSPGMLSAYLSRGHDVHLIASTEHWDTVTALHPSDAKKAEVERRRGLLALSGESLRTGFGAELVLAADEFVIAPAARVEDRAHSFNHGLRNYANGPNSIRPFPYC